MQIVKRFSSSGLWKRVVAANDPVSGSTGSAIHRRRKSYAAAVPSDSSKKYRRVPKEERKLMVESYVNKYRAMNSGKFPTPSEACKQVGGSYYVIKRIVQELEYQSRISSMSTTDKVQKKVITDGSKLSDVRKLPMTKMSCSKNMRQDGQTRDDIFLSKEAEKLSRGQFSLDAGCHEDVVQTPMETEAAKKNESYVKVNELEFKQTETNVGISETAQKSTNDGDSNHLRGRGLTSNILKNESTEMKTSSRDEISLNAKMLTDAWTQRDAASSLESEAANKMESTIGGEEMLYNQRKTDERVWESGCDHVNSCNHRHFVDKKPLTQMTTPSATGDITGKTNVPHHNKKEEAADHQSSDKASDSAKKKNGPGDKLEVHTLKPGTEKLHQAQKVESFKRDLSKEHEDGSETWKKSNMWRSLKSLADGLFNFWRK